MGAAFAHHVTQAATLLELAAERERPDSARMLPLPGLDDVEAWVVAGRHDAAQRALARRRVDARAAAVAAVGDPRARRRLARRARGPHRAARAGHAREPHDRVALRARADRPVRCAGLVRAGELQRAHGLFLSAIELFDDAGADAWTTIALDEHAEVVRLLGGPVPEDLTVAVPGPPGVPGVLGGGAVGPAGAWPRATRAAGLPAAALGSRAPAPRRRPRCAPPRRTRAGSRCARAT